MQAWEKFLTHLEKDIGLEPVKKWLRPLEIEHFDAGNLYLQAKDSFQIAWFDEHIRHRAIKFLANNNKRPIKVHLEVGKAKSSLSKKGKGIRRDIRQLTSADEMFLITFEDVDPTCRLDNFVCNAEHPLCYELISQLAGRPPSLNTRSLNVELCTFNPIYIHGAPGSGKTHLLMALTSAYREKGLKVIYARADTFTQHVVTAIRAGEMSVFRQAYRQADLLILDDVQNFSKKWATQEELFHTFNTIQANGKQIVLSSSCIPSQLQEIEPRLVSRFEWGIVLPLEAVQKEERKKLLQLKAEALNYSLNPRVVDFLLESFPRTTSLCRALKALILRTHMHPTGAHLSATQLTIPFVQQQLADLIREEEKKALTQEMIVQQVAEHYGITSEDILGKAQSRDCVLPRQIAMYFFRTELQLSFIKIGDFFNRDHSTVMTSVKLIQSSLEANNADLHLTVGFLLRKFRA